MPMYRYEPPPNYGAPPPQTVAAAGAAGAAASPQQQVPATGQTEAFPSSPGPEYVWMPSYWTTSVRGDWVWIGGHYVARQGLSDEQLRAARGMLEQAKTSLKGKSLKRVNEAIDEINDALDTE